MTNKDKIIEIQNMINEESATPKNYHCLLEKMDDLITNYGDYMITEPIDCKQELERLEKTDYELCAALLTMLLRADHFDNGSFERYYRQGTVHAIMKRMIELLKK